MPPARRANSCAGRLAIRGTSRPSDRSPVTAPWPAVAAVSPLARRARSSASSPSAPSSAMPSSSSRPGRQAVLDDAADHRDHAHVQRGRGAAKSSFSSSGRAATVGTGGPANDGDETMTLDRLTLSRGTTRSMDLRRRRRRRGARPPDLYGRGADARAGHPDARPEPASTAPSAGPSPTPAATPAASPCAVDPEPARLVGHGRPLPDHRGARPRRRRSAPCSSAATAPPDDDGARARGLAARGGHAPPAARRRRPPRSRRLAASPSRSAAGGRGRPRPVTGLPEPAAAVRLSRRRRGHGRALVPVRARARRPGDRRSTRAGSSTSRRAAASRSARSGSSAGLGSSPRRIAGGSSDAAVATLFLWVYGWVGIAVLLRARCSRSGSGSTRSRPSTTSSPGSCARSASAAGPPRACRPARPRSGRRSSAWRSSSGSSSCRRSAPRPSPWCSSATRCSRSRSWPSSGATSGGRRARRSPSGSATLNRLAPFGPSSPARARPGRRGRVDPDAVDATVVARAASFATGLLGGRGRWRWSRWSPSASRSIIFDGLSQTVVFASCSAPRARAEDAAPARLARDRRRRRDRGRRGCEPRRDRGGPAADRHRLPHRPLPDVPADQRPARDRRVSDPLQQGSDLFGTAFFRADPSWLPPGLVWTRAAGRGRRRPHDRRVGRPRDRAARHGGARASRPTRDMRHRKIPGATNRRRRGTCGCARSRWRW